jgi:hypothetical protein
VRTCFQTEQHLRANAGQRIDHFGVERSLIEGKTDLRVASFDTLQQFGGSRKGSSDHCPLWCRLERRCEEENVLAVQTAQLNDARIEDPKDALDKTILEAIENLTKQKTHLEKVVVEEKAMSDAFRDNDSDDEEEMTNEEIVANVDNDDVARPFEDCPMPILRCSVGLNEPLEVQVLVDSGSSLDLISENLARKLQKTGLEAKEVKKEVRIKVANGRRSTLREAMVLKLRMGIQETETLEFLILKDLPFDFILGHETCRRWKSALDWNKSTFSTTPGVDAQRVEMHWSTYNGQYWRRPVMMVAAETLTIQPECQQGILVDQLRKNDEEQSTMGLVTPLRTETVLDSKFGIAYIFGKDIEYIVVMNLTKKPLTIKKGMCIAEFHPKIIRCSLIILP